MRHLTLAALVHRTAGHRTSVRTRSAADQRLLDVALTISRQGIRPPPLRRS